MDADDKSGGGKVAPNDWQKVHEEALLEYERDSAKEQGNIEPIKT